MQTRSEGLVVGRTNGAGIRVLRLPLSAESSRPFGRLLSRGRQQDWIVQNNGGAYLQLHAHCASNTNFSTSPQAVFEAALWLRAGTSC